MDMNVHHPQKKQKSDDVQVAVYRIIEVPPNVEGVTKAATIQFVPKSEIEDDVSNQCVAGDNVNVTFTTSFVIDEDNSVKQHSTTQIIRLPVDLRGRQRKCVDGSDVDGSGNESSDRNFPCFMCEKTFKHSSHLKRHINTHTGERIYKCDLCEKTFLDASTLSRHRKIHSGDKPWSCKICKKSFGTLGSLRRHITVHNQEGRPFQCETCLKRFPDNSSYQKHKFIHTGIKPHVCNTCGKAFVHIGDLNGHRKIHVEVKPYNCDRCGKDFAKHSNYARHLLIHEGDTDFSCSICGVSYNFQSSLTRHILTHVRRGNKAPIESTSDGSSKSTLKEDNPDAVLNINLEGVEESISEKFKKNIVKITRTRMKHHNKIKQLNKLQEVRKSGKQRNDTPVVCDQNSDLNTSGKDTENQMKPVCDPNDPTVLPPQDENLSKQTTTEDVSSLLRVPEDFGSTKNIPQPFLTSGIESSSTFSPEPLSYQSGSNEGEYIISSNQPGLISDRTPTDSDPIMSGNDSLITIISLSDQVNVGTAENSDLGISGVKNTKVLLAVIDGTETIIPDNGENQITVSEKEEITLKDSDSKSEYIPVTSELKREEILLLKRPADLVLSKDSATKE